MHCLVNENADKIKESPEERKRKKTVALFLEFVRYAYFMKDKDDCTFTNLMLRAIQWKNTTTNSTATEHNKTVLKLFKQKKSLLNGLDALERVAERLLDKLSDLHHREFAQGVYNSNWEDSNIRTLIRCAKEDFRMIKVLVTTFVYDPTIGTTNLWCFVNETCKDAQTTQIKWIQKIANNTLVQKMRMYNQVNVEEWVALSTSSALFDEDKFRKDQASDELQRKQFNHYKKLVTFNSNKNTVRHSNPNQTSSKSAPSQTKQNNPSQNTTQKRIPPKKKRIPRKKIFAFITNLKKDDSWKTTHCAFFNHPETTCKKGTDCSRKHECPICNQAHPIYECNQK